MTLEGKVALVTGSARGIGRAIALELAKEGADVALHYCHSSTDAEVAREEVSGLGRQAYTFQADLSQESSTSGLVSSVLDRFGRIDILVNNAGYYRRLDFSSSTPADWDLTFSINLRSVYFLCQALAPHMLDRGSGTIVNISSDAAYQAKEGTGFDYAASKAALLSLTASLALTLAPSVRVNAVSPGYTYTSLSRAWENVSVREEIERGIPLGKMNMPEDIAHIVAFLVSDKARYITGQNFVIDGGRSLL